MKRISYYLSAILALLFLSCGDEDKPELPGGGDDPDDPTKQETPVSIEITGEASWSPFASRASIDGNVVAWGDYESFRLYDEVGKKVSNTKMSFGKTNGAATGAFTGIVAYEEGARKFWAVFPYAVSFSTADSANAYPVAISAAQNSASAASYLIGVASAAVTGNPGTDNPLALPFKPVAARWDVNIVNEDGYSVKSVKVTVDPDGTTSTIEPFVTEASINLKNDYSTAAISVTPVTYSQSVSTAFATVQTAAAFKASLFLLPATITGDFKIMVTLEDNSVLKFSLDGFDQTFEGGMLYTSNIDLEDAEEDEPDPEPDPDFDIVNGTLVAYYGAGGDIKIPDAVTAIKDGVVGSAQPTGVFERNMTITSVDLNNVVTVGIQAFKSAENLTYVNAPNVEYVKDEGFHAAKNLVTVISPKLTRIDAHGFQTCEKLTTIDLSNLTELRGQRQFRQCYVLNNIDLRKVTVMEGRGGFHECYELESVNMESFTGSIPWEAFQTCRKLASVSLPKATSIGGTDMAANNRGQVFANIAADVLTTLDLPEVTLLAWRSINGTISTLNVPKVTQLGPQSLAFMSKLTYLRLPSLVEIGESQFYNNIGDASMPLTLVLDLSEATELTTVAANAFPDIDVDAQGHPIDLTIYVANEAKKALFPAYTKIKLLVGAPPVTP